MRFGMPDDSPARLSIYQRECGIVAIETIAEEYWTIQVSGDVTKTKTCRMFNPAATRRALKSEKDN
jgi:hypothetical protein